MKTHRIVRGLKVLFFVLVAATIFSYAVLWLWNWLIPAIFGLHAISFWQALGLLVLSKILFGGFHGHHGFGESGGWRFIRRWQEMTPEEREKFRAGLRAGCGPFESSPAAPKP